MATDTMDPAFYEPSARTQPELLLSAVLHLMSHYTAHAQESQACTRLASVIERHLKVLAELPELAPVLQATCLQLSEQWASLVDRTIRPAQRPSLFLRLIAGNRTH
ncbi:MAG TPA: hypothetical protein VIM12_16870 [Noviherbaspirillum sp.]|jgi:hypothetical protein|uniref:hypothetical protein n=1 Tax=Noviherbaspirillum sp. TaxID=1926288 RepID=UPI002F94F954